MKIIFNSPIYNPPYPRSYFKRGKKEAYSEILPFFSKKKRGRGPSLR